jgi:shikimate dehydrogenase
MRNFGLIGYPLGHSFSKLYFERKFREERIKDASYESFELRNIDEFPLLLESYPALRGLNVTIPYKEQIKGYLNSLDKSASRVGAVNVIRFDDDGTLKGFNSDYYGFRLSLEKWLDKEISSIKALILGTGGAAKAVKAVFEDAGIDFITISRDASKGMYTYIDLNENPELVQSHRLIINTTPLGMSPRENELPNLPYDLMDERNYLYDLIYNPDETLFMATGKERKAKVKNGYEMLVLQAEKSWAIWNNPEK